MNPHRVEDYLSELLGMPPAIAPPPPAAADDSISEDEFEALLDALHGGAVPGMAAAPAAPAPAGDSISEDEFEALLDALHGGAAPGTATPLPVAPSAPADALARSAQTVPAEAIAPPPAVTGGEPRSSRWLRLRVHQQDYAVELLRVQEVLLPVAVLALRDTEPALRGVMNLRGVVVPVLDLGLWLELEEVSDTPQTRFVVLEHNGDSLALKVSAVLDVHAVADREIEPAEHTLVDASVAQLRGVARLNGQPVILLDALGLLG
jgi:purine-binding chemotaxis protein CheW